MAMVLVCDGGDEEVSEPTLVVDVSSPVESEVASTLDVSPVLPGSLEYAEGSIADVTVELEAKTVDRDRKVDSSIGVPQLRRTVMVLMSTTNVISFSHVQCLRFNSITTGRIGLCVREESFRSQ